MAESNEQIIITHQSERIECADGCCVDYIDYLLIDGHKVQFTGYDSDLTIAQEVLEAVGYDVEVIF